MKDRRLSEETENAIRQALRQRADSVSPQPNQIDLARRIERAEHPKSRLRLLGAAAAIVVAAAVGGGVGVALVPSHPQHLSDAGKLGNQGGALPTGPAKQHRANRSRATAAYRPGPSIVRVTKQGTHLDALSAWLKPLAVTSGASLAGCYRDELVATSATGNGGSAGSTGIVALQPLAANGLELVDSGTAPAGVGKDVWWATVAVGDKVARVAAEEPNGVIDAMKPVDGLAVLGGLVKAPAAGRFFSVVAETPAGQSIHSLGFLAGWGPKAWGTGLSQASATKGCAAQAGIGGDATTLSSQPAAPLLAGSSVVASFHQAYTAGLGSGLTENISAVAASQRLLAAARSLAVGRAAASASVAAASTAADAARARAIARQVEVARVAFLSAGRAEVVYRTARGRWRTGTAVLGPSGLWRVSQDTFCGSLTSGLPPGDSALLSLRRACSAA